MSIIAPPQTVVAESREAFDRLIEEVAVEIDLPSEAAEQAYEKADWRLHLQVCDVMGVTDGYERSDRLVWLDGDWWPNQTKHIAVDATAFGPEQVKALRALLQGEFEDWRITVGINRDFNSNESEYIGGLCIYRRSLCRKKLSSLWRGTPEFRPGSNFTVRCVGVRQTKRRIKRDGLRSNAGLVRKISLDRFPPGVDQAPRPVAGRRNRSAVVCTPPATSTNVIPAP